MGVGEKEDVCGLGPYCHLCGLRAELQRVEVMQRAPLLGLTQRLLATPGNSPGRTSSRKDKKKHTSLVHS